ncbi:MAG: hypothetical protein QOD86_3 [Miltoncostaeaceae bacterium]|jgi:hypothetical protein|nr:hypothetical protein [Miltoncostaeaceae bacterium]
MCLVHTHEAADARPRRRAPTHDPEAVHALPVAFASAAPAAFSPADS